MFTLIIVGGLYAEFLIKLFSGDSFMFTLRIVGGIYAEFFRAIFF